MTEDRIEKIKKKRKEETEEMGEYPEKVDLLSPANN
jgi:hypothetical protein